MNIESIKKKVLSPNDIWVFVAGIITGVITHFYFFTHEVMAPDMVARASLFIATNWEAQLGRWGIHIVDSLRNGMINPFLIAMTCILCVALSAVCIVKTLDIKNKLVAVLAAIVLMVAPQMAETLMFIFTADSYCFALLLSSVTVYLITRENSKLYHYILAGGCAVFAIGLYQAYIGIIVGLTFIVFIKKILRDEDAFYLIKWFFQKMLFILAALITYYLFTNLYLKLHDLEFASYKGADSLGFGLILQLPTTILRAYKDFKDFLFGERVILNDNWHRDIINGIIVFIICFGIGYIVYTKKLYKKPLKLVLLAFSLLLFPVAVNVLDLIMPTTSINLVTGYALILFYILFLLVIENSLKRLLLPSTIMTMVLCVTFLFSNNASYMARNDVFQHYYAESLRIITKVEMVEGYSTELKWMFSDNIQYVSDYSKLGNGFISDDYMTTNAPSGIWLNRAFYKKYFGKSIEMVSYAEHNAILASEEFAEMGVYPSQDSIKIINNIVVIKLSENGTYAK